MPARSFSVTITVAGGGSAPVAGTLNNQTFTENTGIQTYDISGGWTGTVDSYGITSPPTGVTLPSGSTVQIDTAATGRLAGTTINVTATNGNGTTPNSFTLAVQAAQVGAAWYDDVFGLYTGATPVGSRAVSPTAASTWAASEGGASDDGTEVTISGAGVTADSVDFVGRNIFWTGANGTATDIEGDLVGATRSGHWQINGDDFTGEYFTFDNETSPSHGDPPIFFHATLANGTHTLRYGHIRSAPTDCVKAPNNGTLNMEWCFFDGYYLGQQGVHLDLVDMKASGASSSITDSLFVFDLHPSSPVDASYASTGGNSAIRCVSSDTHGYDGSGRTYERLIIVGSNDIYASAELLSFSSPSATGITFYDVLVDMREHNNLFSPGCRAEDWKVNLIDWDQCVADGFITVGAEVPYPNLGAHPAAVPSTMAAPSITGGPGAISWSDNARPWNQRSLITQYDLRYSTDGASWTTVQDVSLTAGSIAVPAGNNYRIEFRAVNGIGNAAWSPSSNQVNVTAANLAVDEMDFDGYVFDANSTDTATVTLTGTAATGTPVQARGYSASGTTAWGSATADGSGNWTVTVDVPAASWAPWFVPQARVGSTGTPIAGTNTFGCGDVLGVVGQSELVHWLTTQSFRNQITKELDTENLTVILADADDGSGITTARLTSATLSDANVGTLALANAYGYVRPNRKLMIVDLAHQGTNISSLWNDSDTSRNWSTLSALVAKARASGSDFGGLIFNWYNAPAASIDTMLDDWAPGMFGQLASGAAFTLGNNNTEGAQFTGAIDHCFWDVEAATDAQGRGLFARDRTKLHLMLPLPFNDIANGAGEDTAFDETKRMTNAERAGILTFAADSRVQTFLASVGPGTHLADFDEDDTGVLGIHPNRFDALGIPWFACQHLPALLRQSGMTVGEPQITGITQVNSTTVDVEIDLPNGGNLTTLRSLLAIADPGTIPPHFQDVVGVQIDRTAGTKRPIYATSETSYPSLYRGTVTIQDSGTGTAPNRTGKVRVVMTDDFATGDQLTWLDGQANAVLSQTRDEAAKLFLDMLIETVPAWRDTGSLYPYHGVPVRPQTTIPAIS